MYSSNQFLLILAMFFHSAKQAHEGLLLSKLIWVRKFEINVLKLSELSIVILDAR